MSRITTLLLVGSALLAATSVSTPTTVSAAGQRVLAQGSFEQVRAEYAQNRRYRYAKPGPRSYRRGNPAAAAAAGAAIGILGGAAAAAAAPQYYGYPSGYGYAAPSYGYAAPGYGYAAPGYACDPYYGC